jgi:hypothetical protein
MTEFGADLTKCPICDTEFSYKLSLHDEGRIYDFTCSVCGRVKISQEASFDLHNQDKKKNYLLSAFTRWQTERGLEPEVLTSERVKNILNGDGAPTTISQKLDLIIQWLAEKSPITGKYLLIAPSTLYPIAYAKKCRRIF